MNFSLPSPPGPTTAPPQAVRDLPPRERPTRRKGIRKAPWILGALVLTAGAAALTGVPGVGDWLGVGGLFAAPSANVITYEVQRVKLPVTVLEKGSLESSNNTDVTNEVEGMTTILMIKPEGTRVTKGELVCELDSAGLRDQLVNQEISSKRAEADLEQARKTLEVAEISVREYLEGTFPESEQNAEGAIALAMSELARAEERLTWSNRMLEIGYVTQQQNYSDRMSLQKAQFSLREAETKLKVLREYTKQKQVKELQASVEKARSDMLAKQSTYELEKAKEQKLKDQVEKCKLYAPSNGLVVYANEQNRFGGSSQALIEEGASVRERQPIFRLPDLDNMQINTKVHESMVDRVVPGLKARIRVDAFAQRPLVGTVKSVNPLPDPTSFFSSDIKVYTTMVTIDNGFSELRPGMTAQVEILVTQLDDVLAVPVQAILQYKGKDYAYVALPDGNFVRKEIVLGISNEKLVEVKEGIVEGESVALNPVALMSEQEKREAFSVASKGAGGGEWSADAVSAGRRSPGEAGPEAKDGAAAKKAPGAGAAAVMQKLQSLSEEDRSKLRDPSTTAEERQALMQKAGISDAEMQQMRQGGGRGGRGGPGGPGGGGAGGGGGGSRGGPGGPGGSAQ